jgi:hypothetical protein
MDGSNKLQLGGDPASLLPMDEKEVVKLIIRRG